MFFSGKNQKHHNNADITKFIKLFVSTAANAIIILNIFQNVESVGGSYGPVEQLITKPTTQNECLLNGGQCQTKCSSCRPAKANLSCGIYAGLDCCFEEGVTTLPYEPCKGAIIDVVLVVDQSDSITEARYKKHVIPALKKIIESFVSGDGNVGSGRHIRFAMIAFSDSGHLIFDFSKYKDTSSLIAAVSSAPFMHGGTMTANALSTADYALHGQYRSYAKKVMIVITDGVAQDPDSIPLYVTRLKAQDIQIYALAVGQIQMSDLLKITGNDKSHIIQIEKFNQLESVSTKLVQNVCEDCLTSKK